MFEIYFEEKVIGMGERLCAKGAPSLSLFPACELTTGSEFTMHDQKYNLSPRSNIKKREKRKAQKRTRYNGTETNIKTNPAAIKKSSGNLITYHNITLINPAPPHRRRNKLAHLAIPKMHMSIKRRRQLNLLNLAELHDYWSKLPRIVVRRKKLGL
jgi:hypothetical protein